MQIPERSIKDNLLLILKGLAMGAANKVPGVSGGVVAFVTGFYEEFIYSLQQFDKTSLSLLSSFSFKKFWKHINGNFLGLLIVGMLISYFSVSRLLDYFLNFHETHVWGLFFGMILGSVITIVNSFNTWNTKSIVFLLLGIIIGLFISFMEPAQQNDNLLFVFFCGIIGVSGMTLPGLSGSFILILLGNYVLLLVDSVNTLSSVIYQILNYDFSFMQNHEQLDMLVILIVFTLGSLVGLIFLSHILGWVIKNYKPQTYSIITGFILGSLGVVWPWKNKIYKIDHYGDYILDTHGNKILLQFHRFIPDLNFQNAITFIWILIGLITVVYLDKIANKSNTVS